METRHLHRYFLNRFISFIDLIVDRGNLKKLMDANHSRLVFTLLTLNELHILALYKIVSDHFIVNITIFSYLCNKLNNSKINLFNNPKKLFNNTIYDKHLES